MKRRTFLKTVPASAAAMIGLSTPVAADQISAGQSPLVRDAQGWLWWSLPEAAIRRHGQPSFIVRYSDGKFGSLEEWASNVGRTLVHDSDYEDVALVATSPADIEQLLTFEWIESIDLDLEVQLIEPIAPAPAADVGLDSELSFWQMLRIRADTEDLESGLAFESDMPDADIDDVKSVTSAEDRDAPDRIPVVLDTGASTDIVSEARVLDASKNYVGGAGPTVGEGGMSAIEDENGHGDWVLGSILEYADPNDTLVLKTLADDGSGSAYWISEALRYGAEEVGSNGVACLSLGSPVYSYELDQAISYASGAGLPCVVAAGNDRMGTRTVSAPANSSDAITVTASTAEMPSEARSAYFHNVDPVSGTADISGGHTAGEHIDVTAPGCEIHVEGAGRKSGTSMATPIVTAGLLILQSEDSAVRGAVEVQRDRLRDYAAPMPAAGVTEAGSGFLDVGAMIEEDAPSETQSDVRNEEAEARDATHRALTNAEGGWFTLGI